MRFGVMFAALLLAIVGLATPFGALAMETTALKLARVALGIVCLNSAFGLLRRQPWSRWSSLVALLLLVALGELLVVPAGGVALLVLFFSSLFGVALLVLPATGQITPADDGRPSGSTIGLVAALSFLVFLGALGWHFVGEGARAAESSPAPIQIAGMAPRVSWLSFGRAIERAEERTSPIVAVFETGWCGYCKKMNKTTFKDPQVVDRLNELVAVKVNAEDGSERDGYSGRDLAARYGVSGYPTLMVLSPDGRVLARRSGYLSASELMTWINSTVSIL